MLTALSLRPRSKISSMMVNLGLSSASPPFSKSLGSYATLALPSIAPEPVAPPAELVGAPDRLGAEDAGGVGDALSTRPEDEVPIAGEVPPAPRRLVRPSPDMLKRCVSRSGGG